MRALIRGKEVCLENAWTKWQRMNILFLTGKEKDVDGNPLPGDGWTLVEDYQEPTEDVETVLYNGKTYTKDELLALLNQTS